MAATRRGLSLSTASTGALWRGGAPKLATLAPRAARCTSRLSLLAVPTPAPRSATPTRRLHGSAAARAAEDGGGGGGGGPDFEGAGMGGGEAEFGPQKKVGEREGRPFLDPRAPRRIDAIRSDPAHKQWGGMIDILEHAAYCNGQREENEDGFFFDLTIAKYDSDCEEDPFSANYLTEDEIEFPEDYVPEPYVPDRVAKQIYFLFSARKYSVAQLCARFHLSSERVSAIIHHKRTEPEMIALGMYDTRIDELLGQLYEGALADRGMPSENWGPNWDIGVNTQVLPDDQMPDDVLPVRRRVGNTLREGHRLPKLPVPAVKERTHHAKYVFRDISGRRKDHLHGRPLLVADWDGSVRAASNKEALYRSWEMRYWGHKHSVGTHGMPYADADADKPQSYHLPP